MPELTVTGMVGSLVTIVVGVALIPVIYAQLTHANITDPTVSAMLSLIPFMFGVGLLVATVKGLI
jgi:hypothetical protein